MSLWTLRNWFAHAFVCSWRGHDDPTAFFCIYILSYCRRCNSEVHGRTFDDLKKLPPCPDDVREAIEQLEQWEEDCHE